VRRVHPPGEAASLPPGVEIYSFPAEGVAIRRTRTGVDEPDGFLPFIDTGQRARYFIGDAATSPERPSNATFKLGEVRPHSAFIPHAHGGEHFVLSLGYASCGLYDVGAERTVRVTLTPGTLIRIPALMPHSFGNRAGGPLLILAANTGFGIDHEDYAITAPDAEARGSEAGVEAPYGDFPRLAKALRALESANDPGTMTLRERIANRLRRAAYRLEAPR
jgi:hypothetical protein